MSFEFVPGRLIKTRRDIELVHKSTRESVRAEKSEELHDLVVQLCGLAREEVEQEAYALTEREVRMVAAYIPFNYYDVDMTNLFMIFEERSGARLCDLLFTNWQNSYRNADCNRFMQSLISRDTDFLKLIRSYYLDERWFSSVLADQDIARRFIRELCGGKNYAGRTLADKMKHWGISESSRLYLDCEFLFYTACSRDNYYEISKDSLMNIVVRYHERGIGVLKLFVRNFLSELKERELFEFDNIARYLVPIVGDTSDFRKIDAFFEDISQYLKIKYHDWVNRFKIEDLFGKDSRSEFWKQFRFITVRKRGSSDAVIMEFENYYAIEFLGRATGPIYLYGKDYFEQSVLKMFDECDNSQLRSMLYKRTKYYYRKEHHKNWQDDVYRKLVGEKIAKTIFVD